LLLRALSEDGYGDVLMFCRFAHLIEGRVSLAVPPRLIPLLARSFPSVVSVDECPKADLQAPLCSVPAILGTRLDTIPAKVPYLTPAPELVAKWKEQLAGPGLKVGLVWASDPRHETYLRRNVPLSALAPLADLPGLRLFAIQKGAGSEDVAGATFPLTDLGPDLDNGPGAFEDTAALMRCLDVVVTIDSAPAHLAGALGVRTWLLLRHVPAWTWLLGRDDSPWYPTLRIFRQERPGDWPGVIERVAGELVAL
jgi:hypothetical protein